ncbi:MAG: hypothetical protein V7782_04090 [Psychromonas sp.]
MKHLRLIAVLVITIIIDVTFVNYHSIYWGDIVAKYTNYFVAMMLVPFFVCILLNAFIVLTLRNVKEIRKHSLLVILVPCFFPLAMLLYVLAMVNWGGPH